MEPLINTVLVEGVHAGQKTNAVARLEVDHANRTSGMSLGILETFENYLISRLEVFLNLEIINFEAVLEALNQYFQE